MGTLSLTRTQFGTSQLHGGRWVQIAYALTDVFFVGANAILVCYFRFGSDWRTGPVRALFSKNPQLHFREQYLGFLLIYTCLLILFFRSRDLYGTARGRSALDESFAVLYAVTLSSGMLTVFLYLSKQDISRLVVGLNGALDVFTLAGWRLWKRRVIERFVAQGYGVRNVLIVGTGKLGRQLAKHFEVNKRLGYVVRGFVDRKPARGPHVLGKIEDLPQLILGHFVDEIFIATPSDKGLVKAVFLEACRNHVEVKLVPELYEGLARGVPIEYLGDLPIMALYERRVPELGLLVKRTMDIVVSLVGLVLLSPILAAIVLAIKLDSPGSVFFCATRVGKKGSRFTCYKFRTMVPNAAGLKESLLQLNERQGPCFKIANDPRMTRIGRILRKYSLDELPQLWNVLRGDMSLVGPRPHSTEDYQRYAVGHLRRLGVTPGITGLWQISARQDPSFESVLTHDTEYIEKWNLWLDIKILLKTIPAVFQGSGE